MSEENDTIRICGVAGSLRAGSFNRAAMAAAVEVQPAGLVIDVFGGLADVPLFNQDVEAAGDPVGVTALKEAIRQADGLLIASPEYNGGIPGVLKNALDWGSRKGADESAALARKPCAVFGASPGRLGTARAQLQVRQTLAGAGAVVMPKPEVHLMSIAPHVRDGVVADAQLRELIASLLDALAAWTRRFSAGEGTATG